MLTRNSRFAVIRRNWRAASVSVARSHPLRKARKAAAIRSRIRTHVRRKRGWTHFSFFEVHDNISAEEIRELEALLLQIFRHDSRIGLTSVEKGYHKFYEARKGKRRKT